MKSNPKKVIKIKKSKNDPFLDDIRNPAHANPKKVKKLNLKKIEDELWSS